MKIKTIDIKMKLTAVSNENKVDLFFIFNLKHTKRK